MNLLNEREKTHGDYSELAFVSQYLKLALSYGPIDELPAVHRESLEMICVKMARIVCGDHNEADHWTDLIGYSQLVLNHIKKDVPGSSTQQEPPDEENECDFCGGDIYHRPWCILRRNEG